MSDLRIRKAILKDALNLSVLKKQVFISTYAIEGIRKDFSEYIQSEFSVEMIEKDLKNDNKIILLAENKEFLVGCAEIGLKNHSPEIKSNSPELSVLYVFEHFKAKGVGYSLITHAEDVIKKMGFHELWLSVYHLNENAILFYKRQNYRVIGNTYFEMDGLKYENLIMSKNF